MNRYDFGANSKLGKIGEQFVLISNTILERKRY